MPLHLLLANDRCPPAESDSWRTSDKWAVPWQWFYQLGNYAVQMTRYGRVASGLLAVALGALVWGWWRQLFGPVAGMLSLLLYVLNPSILANGALMTSDTAAALFFFAATWSWWRVLQRLTVARVLISALALGGLFLSKTSAVLILPIALVLVVARLLKRKPLSVRGFGLRELRGSGAQLLAFAGAGAAHLIVVLLLIWSFHGFRYTAFAPGMSDGAWNEATWETLLVKPVPSALFQRIEVDSEQNEKMKRIFAREHAGKNGWSAASLKALNAVKREVLREEQVSRIEQLLAEPAPQLLPRMIETLRHYRLLPEAYIYGVAHVWRGSRERAAFFNGEFSIAGWRTFFPYTFLVKTPLPLFVVIALAVAAAVTRSRSRPAKARTRAGDWALYDTLPLWVLFGVYWIAAVSSHLNIGHRHILPTYPPLFVLCGASALWCRAWPGIGGEPRLNGPFSRSAGIGLCIALALLAGETIYRFPNYLAYFNGFVRPA